MVDIHHGFSNSIDVKTIKSVLYGRYATCINIFPISQEDIIS